MTKAVEQSHTHWRRLDFPVPTLAESSTTRTEHPEEREEPPVNHSPMDPLPPQPLLLPAMEVPLPIPGVRSPVLECLPRSNECS